MKSHSKLRCVPAHEGWCKRHVLNYHRWGPPAKLDILLFCSQNLNSQQLMMKEGNRTKPKEFQNLNATTSSHHSNKSILYQKKGLPNTIPTSPKDFQQSSIQHQIVIITIKKKNDKIKQTRTDPQLQQGKLPMNHLITLTGSFIRPTAKLASAAKQIQHGQRQLNTVLQSKPRKSDSSFNDPGLQIK